MMNTAARTRRVVLTTIIIACFLGGSAAFAQQIVMTSHFPSDQLILGKWIELIYTEALQHIGLEMQYVFHPYKRGDYLVESGRVDGALARPYDYGRLHPNLVRVEEPAPIDRLCAYAKDTSIHIDGWEGFQGTTYQIDSLRGFVLVEMNLPQFVAEDKIDFVDDWVQGLKKVTAGRTDILLGPESIMTQFLSMDAFRDSGIVQVGVIQEVALYAYLQQQHAGLAPQLAETLRQMKTENLIEQYRQDAENALKGSQ